MKKITLFFLGLLINASLYSQAIPNVDWIRNFSEKPAIANIPSAIDASNNVYVTGYTFTGTLYDYTTLKYDQLGNLLWTAHYNGPANGDDFASAIALDGSGNVYVTGKSSGIGTGFDYATVKYNSAGVQQWVARYNNPLANGNDEAAVLLVDNSTGAVYVTGKSLGLTSGDDYTTIKYNSSGAQQWATRYNGLGNAADKAVSIAFGTGSKLFVTGTAKGLLNNDIVTLRYNTTSGTATWTKTYNGTSNLNDACFGMVTDGNDVFICGGTQASLANNNYVLQKLSGNTGATQWTSFYDGYGMDDFASSVVIDASNNPVITGVAKNTSTYEYHTVKYNSAGVQQWVGKYNANITSPTVNPKLALDPFNYYYVCGETRIGTNTDFALLQYTTSGVHNWTETHNGIANGNDAATDMVVDNMARIYITGQTYNGSAKYDYTTIKYSQTPVYPIIDFNSESASNSFAFYENKGQLLNTNGLPIPEVKYYTDNTSQKLYFQKTSLSYVFSRVDTVISTLDTLERIDLQFVQSNPLTKPYSFDQQSSYLNYFLENCPTGITDIKGSQRLLIPNIYPNIDLNYYSNQNGLKYYFVVKPGGDPTKIAMLYQGAVSSSVNVGTGELTVNGTIGNIVQDRPTAYQINFFGAIVPITAWQANYLPVGTNTYKFNIGTYNPAFPLIIQVDQGNSALPSSSSFWSTYYGGTNNDPGSANVEMDASGNAYLVGSTRSSDLPFTSGVVYDFYQNGDDAFVVKFDKFRARVWSTYYGGGSGDGATGVQVDASSNVYFVGHTTSADFPLFGSYQTFNTSGSNDVFIVKLNSAGTGPPLWSTLFGGTNDDQGISISVDNNTNDVFIAGFTWSTIGFPFPASQPAGAYAQTTHGGGGYDGYVAKFDNAQNLIWSTYLGGSANDQMSSTTLDKNGNLIVLGHSFSLGHSSCGDSAGTLPLCDPGGGAYIANNSGNSDLYIAKYTSNGVLLWSTMYGGSSTEGSNGSTTKRDVVVDGLNNICIVGTTASTDLPLYNAIQGSNAGVYDLCILKFTNSGVPIFADYYGGSGTEYSDGAIADGNGNFYFTGTTFSSDFPITFSSNYYNYSSLRGDTDAFLVGLDINNTPFWSTYLGGTCRDEGMAIAISQDESSFVVVGATASLDFPVFDLAGTTDYYDGSYNGNLGTFCGPGTGPEGDAFIGSFCLVCPGTVGVDEVVSAPIEDLNINVYPNPSSSLVNFELTLNKKEDVTFKIYNLLGEIIYSQDLKDVLNKQIQIDFTNFSKGIYFVQVHAGSKEGSAKFIIR